MAAFAALTSLKHIIHNLHNHPSPPISIDKQQLQSLTEILTFLLEFLQGYHHSHLSYSDEADPMETRIANAAYAAEDLIESKIVDRILFPSTIIGKIVSVLKLSSLCKCIDPEDGLYRDLEVVIQELDLIKKVAMAMAMAMEIHKENNEVRPHLRRRVKASSSSTSSSMVGVDDVLVRVLESLTGNQLSLQIFPITGMGGIGKTTLARNIFQHAYIKEHFDIRSWTTISQDYNALEVFKELLGQARGNSSDRSEDELGLELYQHLWGRRYLIVMDDMWSIKVLDRINRYFPNCNNGSRIIITTRLSNFASHFRNGFNMKFLNEVSSWNLFSKTTFIEESCPLELEEIGKKIIRNCRGLPLSIVTVGGLLAKSEQTRECWEHIEKNLNSIVNSEDHDYCLKILKISYNHLPIHLKPCFLYMGVFEEDRKIHVSTLIKLWISEGFLAQASEKALETIARENLKDLVDRNLILVHELGSSGNIKYCKIHDLLRDLCVREAEKQRFYYHVLEGRIPDDLNSWRRVYIQRNTSKNIIVKSLRSMPRARSVICNYDEHERKDPVPLKFRLLRTLKAYDRDLVSKVSYDLEYVFQSVNLRYLAIGAFARCEFSSSLNLLWNLQTLVIDSLRSFTAPVEIWDMPHLRHVKFPFAPVQLPDPPIDNVVVIMENLQTMKTILNFKPNQEVVKRIPNIKRLALRYSRIESNEDYYCLKNLECLHNLESLQCISSYPQVFDFLKKLTFPKSLRKLRLRFSKNSAWEEMLEKIGLLPFLQKLELSGGFFETREWQTVEGQFRKLEFLTLRRCGGLEHWTSDSSHFPLLKEIHLYDLEELEEIPSEIGDIPTLRAIVLTRCGASLVVSAKKIVEEQKELQGGEEELAFHVRVLFKRRKRYGMDYHSESTKESEELEQELMRVLAGPSFEIGYEPEFLGRHM